MIDRSSKKIIVAIGEPCAIQSSQYPTKKVANLNKDWADHDQSKNSEKIDFFLLRLSYLSS